MDSAFVIRHAVSGRILAAERVLREEVVGPVNLSQPAQSHGCKRGVGGVAVLGGPIAHRVEAPLLLSLAEPFVDAVDVGVVEPEDRVVGGSFHLRRR